MEDLSPRGSLRDRILNDLRITVKQLYHESVNKELSTDNKAYLCTTLMKNLDEALRHGLKQLHLGYWKVVERLLHKHMLDAVLQLPAYGTASHTEYESLAKGRAWLALSLNDDSLVSYIECLAREPALDKHYEAWSILRNSDCCNRLLSALSGLDNISFTFRMEYFNKPPLLCEFRYKDIERSGDRAGLELNINLAHTAVSAAATSPVDSGVVLPDSSSDVEQTEIDFINGNVPESVVLRKRKKNTKRHVSFHEDIVCKSPDKCRKLKWDCENQRYSWSGEELNIQPAFVSDLTSTPVQSEPQPPEPHIAQELRDLKERGVPEGQETPCNFENLTKIKQTQKSIIVKRFLQSIKNQSKSKPLSSRYRPGCTFRCDKPLLRGPVPREWTDVLNSEIDLEVQKHKQKTTQHLVERTKLEESIASNNEFVYRVYQLRDFLCILTDCNIYLYNTCVFRVIQYENVERIILYPGGEVLQLLERDTWLRLVGSSLDSTNDMLGRIEWCMRTRGLDPPDFRILSMDDLYWMRGRLIRKAVLHQTEQLVYYGAVQLEREDVLADVGQLSVLRGALMYRDLRQGDNWLPGNFQLKSGVLYMFGEDATPKLAINLASNCKSCARVIDSQRPHTFQLTLLDGDTAFCSHSNCFYEDSSLKSRLGIHGPETKRVLEAVRSKLGNWFGNGRTETCVIQFAASDEFELSEWLQAIVQASCGDCCEDAAREDLTDCTLLLTSNSVVLVTEEALPATTIDVVSSAQISDIASLKMSRDGSDAFAIVEFTCMEAANTSGDWYLHFGNSAQLQVFHKQLERKWNQPDAFPVELLTDQRVLDRCRAIQVRTQPSLC